MFPFYPDLSALPCRIAEKLREVLLPLGDLTVYSENKIRIVAATKDCIAPKSKYAPYWIGYGLPLPDIAAALVALTGSGDVPQPDRGNGLDSGDPNKEGVADPDTRTGVKIAARRRARREGVVELLGRRKAVAAASGPLADARAELTACREALRAAEEALWVQSDVITSYRLALKDGTVELLAGQSGTTVVVEQEWFASPEAW